MQDLQYVIPDMGFEMWDVGYQIPDMKCGIPFLVYINLIEH